jgi:hypothetical protein
MADDRTRENEPMTPRHNEPVTPTQRDTDRDMDPTKRRGDRPDDRHAPDMGGDNPRRDHDKDMPGGTTPTR